ncbi:UNVERIFIED_CONTAM: hypothetical protein K2H54_047132 [Gekko kuhli]
MTYKDTVTCYDEIQCPPQYWDIVEQLQSFTLSKTDLDPSHYGSLSLSATGFWISPCSAAGKECGDFQIPGSAVCARFHMKLQGNIYRHYSLEHYIYSAGHVAHPDLDAVAGPSLPGRQEEEGRNPNAHGATPGADDTDLDSQDQVTLEREVQASTESNPRAPEYPLSLELMMESWGTAGTWEEVGQQQEFWI